MIDLGRIYYLRDEIETESISMSELAEIDEAFDALVKRGVILRDEYENAMALDKLSELEDHATTVEKRIYEWVKENFGEAEANDPSWSTAQLAAELNKLQVIFGADNGTIGALLGEN